jgi:hypothetical protein
MSNLSATHPLYDDQLPDWFQMRVTYRGERYVKAAGRAFLPATPGMIEDGLDPYEPSLKFRTVGGHSVLQAIDNGLPEARGRVAYDAYRMRAVFPDFVRKAVRTMVGIMTAEDAVIELPPQLEPLLERATYRGESLQMLLRRIYREQLISGRLGLIGDVAADRVPILALYEAEAITNWDDGAIRAPTLQSLNLVVLRESEYERVDGFTWEYVDKYRALVLGDVEDNEASGTGAIYRAGSFTDGQQFDPSELQDVVFFGRRTDEIPFVFINSVDVVNEPDEPPLLPLSNLALTVYRGEADFRQALYLQGQDTLVVTGSTDGEDQIRVGAGAVMRIANPQGDAKFIGVDSSGLSEQRTALENDYARSERLSGELLNAQSKQRESGQALMLRKGAQTVTLTDIARTGAFGLQMVLRKMAKWAGADPESVVVEPFTNFVDVNLASKELLDIVSAKKMGLPISWESVHALMRDRGVTRLTFEDEQQLIEAEDALDETMNPDGPVEINPEVEDPEDPEMGTDAEADADVEPVGT